MYDLTLGSFQHKRSSHRPLTGMRMDKTHTTTQFNFSRQLCSLSLSCRLCIPERKREILQSYEKYQYLIKWRWSFRYHTFIITGARGWPQMVTKPQQPEQKIDCYCFVSFSDQKSKIRSAEEVEGHNIWSYIFQAPVTISHVTSAVGVRYDFNNVLLCAQNGKGSPVALEREMSLFLQQQQQH